MNFTKSIISAFLLLTLNVAYAVVYDAKLTINYKIADSSLVQQDMTLLMQGPPTFSTAASWNPSPVNIPEDTTMIAKLNAGQAGPFSGAVNYNGPGTYEFKFDISESACSVTYSGSAAGFIYNIPDPVPVISGTTLICNVDVTVATAPVPPVDCSTDPTHTDCVEKCESEGIGAGEWCQKLCDIDKDYSWCPVKQVTQAVVTINNQITNP